MAERERLPNKERRNRAREERKRREAQAAAKRKKSGLRSSLIGAAIIVVVGAVLAQAFLGGPASIGDAILVSSSEADAAREAAGCEMIVDRQPLEDRTHHEAASVPPADALYGDVRPTHSGPHTVQFHPIVTAGAESQLDERSTTHNLEHGSVIVWYDPEQVDAAGEMGTWSETLNANGFTNPRGGAAVMVAPYTDPGISSGKAVAFRAWGVAMDCDAWDETVANSFVIDHFGTHGIAPERPLGPYPEGVLEYDDVEVEDNTDAPVDGQLMPEDGGDDASTEPAEGETTEGASEDGATEGEATEGADQ